MLHIHVFLTAPLGSSYMTQSGTEQHQRRVAVRKSSNDLCPEPDLSVQPLYGVVLIFRPLGAGCLAYGSHHSGGSGSESRYLFHCCCSSPLRELSMAAGGVVHSSHSAYLLPFTNL